MIQHMEGKIITFNCHDGLTLIGPNPSTYIENGECEPDPREVNRIGEITEVESLQLHYVI